jgi:large subunit ribosomal protein L25
MAMQELTIVKRAGIGKEAAKKLRRAGSVPAILYGGAATQPIAVDPKAVLRMIHGHERSTQLLSLKVEGEASGGTRLAIIRAMQFDPVTEALLHVDLQEVSADRAITVRVGIQAVGEAIGVKDTKGILNLVLHELDIACLPIAIPDRIEADVTSLAIGDVLTVADLRAPEGVRILNDPGQAVATVSPPMAEETPAAAAPAAAAAEPEVLTERKPKEEEGGDEGKKAAKK